jgi:hypothetical protein
VPGNLCGAAYETDLWNEKAATLQGVKFVPNILTYACRTAPASQFLTISDISLNIES